MPETFETFAPLTSLPNLEDGKDQEIGGPVCSPLHTDKGIISSKLCLPDIPLLCNSKNCPGDKNLGLCINKVCEPSNYEHLSEAEHNLCEAQITCFYQARKIIASCQIAIGTLNLLDKNGSQNIIGDYCSKLCINYPELRQWCGRDSTSIKIPSVEQCIHEHYTQKAVFETAVNKKEYIDVGSAPFWLTNCRDFSIGTLQPDFFLCTY